MTKYNYNESINFLEIDPQYIADGIEYAEKNKFNSIRIRTLNKNAGQKYDLDFRSIKNKSFINKLTISDDFKISKILSIESLYTLKKLSHFQSRQSLNIDFSYLTQLESLYIKDDKKTKNIKELVNLKDLLISSIKHDDCTPLSSLKGLEEFRVSGAINKLNGIEIFSNLKYLKISYCNKIVDASLLSKLFNLEKLHIEKCKLLTDFSFLEGNKNIKELFIDKLDSISFVSKMPNLEKINFWDCKDGVMNPLLESKSLKQINFYPNKKYYSHTIEEIIKITGAQRG